MGNMKSSKKTWKEWELEEAHTPHMNGVLVEVSACALA